MQQNERLGNCCAVRKRTESCVFIASRIASKGARRSQSAGGLDKALSTQLIASSAPSDHSALDRSFLDITAPENRSKARTKLPVCPATGKPANCTDPATWTSYGQARATASRFGFDGIGIVFTAADPYTGVDLDHCRTGPGDLEPWASEIVKRINSYTEWSPSGEGLHILVKASLPDRSGRRSQRIEIYSSARYFTITGNHLDGTANTIEERQADILDLAATLDRKSRTRPEFSRQLASVTESDEELIRRTQQARNGAKFQRLWVGDISDYGGDHSRADAALCSLLAYYTNGDPARIDRLFRLSGLYRPKWARPTAGSTYGWITIQAALRNAFGRELDQSTLSFQEFAHNGTKRLCARTGGFYRQHSCAPGARSPTRSFFGLFIRKELIALTRWRTAASHLEVASGALFSKPGPRAALPLLVMVLATWAQDPFSSLGASAQTISTGTFVTGLVEFAIVVAGLLLAFSGRVLGGVLIAIIGGGMLALSAAKWEGWIQGL